MTDPSTQDFDALMARAAAASQANDSAQAIELLRGASAARPSAGLPQFLLGSEFAELGHFAAAEEAFANAIRLAPDFALARYQLGLLQFSSGRPAAALLTWEPLLALGDAAPLRHFVMGFQALAHDAFSDALDHFQRGLALHTDNPALASDIGKVVDEIQKLMHADAPGETAAVSDEPLGEAQDHVLLSRYRQQLH